MKIKSSLSAKAITGTTVSAILAAIILTLFFSYHQKNIIHSDLKNLGLSLTGNLAYNCEYGVLTENTVVLDNLIRGVMEQPDVAYCIVQGLSGGVLAASGLEPGIKSSTDEFARAAIEADKTMIRLFSSRNDQDYYEIIVPVTTRVAASSRDEGALFMEEGEWIREAKKAGEPVEPAGEAIAPSEEGIFEEKIGVVRVGLSLANASAMLSKARNIFIIIVIAIFLVSALVSIRLTKVTTIKPIQTLVDYTRRVARGDFSFKIPIKSRDELGRLAESFNRMVEELRESREQLVAAKDYVDNIISSMNDTLIVVGRDGKIQTVNRAATDLLGYGESELVDRPVADIIEGGESPFAGVELDGAGENISIRNVEKSYLAKDGRKIPVLFSSAPMSDEHGKIIGLACVAPDITERKRAEEELRRFADELSRRNEEIRNFAYIVSHDLRAPLVNLRGFSAELRLSLKLITRSVNKFLSHMDQEEKVEVTTALEKDVPEALGFIESSVIRMGNFIDAVLKLSRLGRLEFHPEEVDTVTLVDETLKSLAHQLEEGKVEVLMAKLPVVVADPTALHQIFGNILNNAVNYLVPDRPGKIEITAARGRLETIFRVRDNGRGIAAEDMPKVFAPFRRAGKQNHPGEGMGMAYVQTLLRRLGGRIWCDSDPNQGTTFSFTLPNHHKTGGYNENT